MDICIATGIYPPLEGGPSSLSFELAKKLMTNRNKVTIVTFHPDFKMTYGIDGRLTVLKLPQPKFGNEKSFNPIRFLFKLLIFTLGLLILKPLKHFKIIHAMDHNLAGIPSIIFTFFTRVPLVVRFPADWLFHVVDERGWKKSALKSQIVLKLQKLVLQLVKQIIVTTKYGVKLLTDYGISKEKIIVIPNAVDINRFHPSRNKGKMKLQIGFKKTQMLILSVCRLHPSKRLDDLILAFTETNKMVKKDLHLLIAGSGPDLERLKRIIKTAGINSNIVFLGQVSNEKIHEIYQAVDLFVLPSSHETFGIAILEAMASGVPTIVARSGGIVSTFTDKKHCLMYEPGNITELKKTLYELITNARSRELYAERAQRMVVKKYSWDSIAQQTLALYVTSINDRKKVKHDL
ncbi:MAG: glycosyltransferase family 4 protein [Candidatus Hodarchaeota archaeon]